VLVLADGPDRIVVRVDVVRVDVVRVDVVRVDVVRVDVVRVDVVRVDVRIVQPSNGVDLRGSARTAASPRERPRARAAPSPPPTRWPPPVRGSGFAAHIDSARDGRPPPS
jgi:hypothetical protein